MIWEEGPLGTEERLPFDCGHECGLQRPSPVFPESSRAPSGRPPASHSASNYTNNSRMRPVRFYSLFLVPFTFTGVLAQVSHSQTFLFTHSYHLPRSTIPLPGVSGNNPHGDRLHLDFYRCLPRPKSPDRSLHGRHYHHFHSGRQCPGVEWKQHGQFDEHFVKFYLHKRYLHWSSTNRPHQCERWRKWTSRRSKSGSVGSGWYIWATRWLCLWGAIIAMERNGPQHRRSHRWRLTIVCNMLPLHGQLEQYPSLV